MARARGANSILLGVFETTYGVVPTSGWFQLPFISHSMGEQQDLIDNNLLGYGREPLAPSKDVINNDGDVVIPMDYRTLGYWLKGMLGEDSNTTTGGNTTHIFTSGIAALPSLSLEFGQPEVPSYGANFGVLVNSMSFSMARSGLLQATMSLIAQGETRATTSVANASPTSLAVTRFAPFQGGVLKDGSALANVVGATVNISNNLDKVEVIRSDGRIGGADTGLFAVSGSIDVRFADTTLLDQATAGSPCDLKFQWVVDATHSLVFDLPGVYLPKPKLGVTGPGGIQATFPFRAARATPTGHALTVTLINDVADY